MRRSADLLQRERRADATARLLAQTTKPLHRACGDIHREQMAKLEAGRGPDFWVLKD